MGWQPDICIHHFPCDDGFGAAWAVWTKWGNEVDYRGTNYGQPIPDHDIDGKRILIADFSFKPDVLRALAARAHSIVILDHHKTAEADLAEFPVKVVGARHDAIDRMLAKVSGVDSNIVTEFDMKRSGASMAWAFCWPDDKLPNLIRYLEDRDLWRMELAETRRVSLLLRSHPFDFEIWNRIADRLDGTEAERQEVFDEAAAIERFYDRKLADMVPTATLKCIGDHVGVPVAHAPYAFASDLAHELLQAYPHAPFAAVVVDAYGARTWSLRSTNERVDVSEVARQYGGGGHRNAAGFRVPA